MTRRSLERNRHELSEFLRHHREKLKPVDVGLPTTGRRRTPGLRREEVASLAGVGLTWYTWFEQGRDINVSERFLLNVAHALKLADAECCHLFLLAHGRPPPFEAHQSQSVPSRIQTLMDEMARPAYIINLGWDVIAWNEPADRLFDLRTRDPAARNLLRMTFADPDLRRRLPAWRHDAFRMLAQFRCDLAATPKAPVVQTLIDELITLSPDFRRWWKEPDLQAYACGFSSIADCQNVHQTFEHEKITVDEHRHLRMIVYFSVDPSRPQLPPESRTSPSG